MTALAGFPFASRQLMSPNSVLHGQYSHVMDAVDVTDQNFSSMRTAMVESQLRTSGVNDARVLAAMASVPREDYVPAERRVAAYIDRAVPVAPGRALNPPLTIGQLLVQADIRPGEKVLLVGAGTGYTAALLRALGATVVAVEEDEGLRAHAAGLLDADVTLVAGPLAAGAPGEGPFDAIVIDGAIDHVPAALEDQLAEGGRILFATGTSDVSRLTIGRKGGGVVGYTGFSDCAAAALPGFARAEGFTF